MQYKKSITHHHHLTGNVFEAKEIAIEDELEIPDLALEIQTFLGTPEGAALCWEIGDDDQVADIFAKAWSMGREYESRKAIAGRN